MTLQTDSNNLVLLNILVALYNSSYSDISGNADDEYMALFASKTLQFVRAPDDNVFIPRKSFPLPLPLQHSSAEPNKAFNLVEIICLVIPFEWWMAEDSYERLNNYVMGVLYSPLLTITAYLEARDARRICRTRRRGESEDSARQKWEDLAAEVDFDVSQSNWGQSVQETKPNVEVPTDVLEIRELKEQVRILMEMVKGLREEGTITRGGMGRMIVNGELSNHADQTNMPGNRDE
jgi:hypothetical protein